MLILISLVLAVSLGVSMLVGRFLAMGHPDTTDHLAARDKDAGFDRDFGRTA